SIGKILPGSLPTHLNGVPLERDGDLNENFHNEILVGPKAVNETKLALGRVLNEVFVKADVDKNDLLDLLELQTWINAKVKEHFMLAAKENFFTFVSLDTDHNGRVSWEEFAQSSLVKKGYTKEEAAKSIKDLKGLPRRLKEQIMLDRAAWFEAATDPAGLNIDEFLTFRHPEHSHVSLLNMVTLQELLLYNDPMNALHAKREAQELIRKADANKDGKLSLKEVLNRSHIFIGSKAVNTAKNIHEEF
ncbi:reticulocalbin-like, partial [Tropilaelaps mercedesae]